uniref:Uncharacterized protein n=1 Tax=Eptatretus burgeri TaxID=7764 RepID=A0A8C4QRV7_EPTBU
MMEGEVQHVTAIVSSSLQDQAVLHRLKENGVRVRLSSSVSRKAVIFPVSGVAFRLVSERDLSAQPVPVDEDVLSIGEDLISELKSFASVHRHAFLLVLVSGMFNLRMYHKLNLIFLQSNLNLIPVANGEAAVKSLLTVAKVCKQPQADLVRQHLMDFLMQMETPGETLTMDNSL